MDKFTSGRHFEATEAIEANHDYADVSFGDAKLELEAADIMS